MAPLPSNNLFAKAWFSRSILSFSYLLTLIFIDFGPTLPDLPGKALIWLYDPKWVREPFLDILRFCLIMALTLLGAITTLLHLPQEISTNLFSRIWLLRLMAEFFSLHSQFKMSHLPFSSNRCTCLLMFLTFSIWAAYCLAMTFISFLVYRLASLS